MYLHSYVIFGRYVCVEKEKHETNFNNILIQYIQKF